MKIPPRALAAGFRSIQTPATMPYSIKPICPGKTLAATLLGLAAFLFHWPLHAQIEHGTVSVTPNDNAPLTSLQPGSSDTVALIRANRADYHFTVSRDRAVNEGVLLTSVAENAANNASSHVSASFDYVTNEDDELFEEFWVATNEAPNGTEKDADVAFAYFPFDEFLGYYRVQQNDGTVTATFSSPGSFLVEQVDTGFYHLDLNGTESDTDGILLVSGGKNEDNFALSRQLTVKDFLIYVKDNGANADTYETNSFSFVYLPVDHPSKQLVALGRIMDDGSRTVTRGDYTITNAPTAGVWHLEIEGHSANTGTLIISPEGGTEYNRDNLWSYQWDPDAGHWVIHSRDIPGLGLQDTRGEAAFNFAFMADTPTYVNHAATGANDGSSWENAYTSLWAAMRDSTPGERIWVARGTYAPSDSGDPEDSFDLKSNVKVYGGFDGTETRLGQRDPNPATNGTILSGELGDPDDRSDNSRNILLATSQSTALSRLDGFTITRGNASGDDVRGGGIRLNSPGRIEIANCHFLDNAASHNGGAVAIGQPGHFVFTNCVFKGNEAPTGGAVFAQTSTQVEFANCVFQGNAAPSSGGAIAALGESEITLTNCSLQGNRTESSIGTNAIFATGSLKLRNSVVWGNQDGDLPPEESFNQVETLEQTPFIRENSLIQNVDIPNSFDGTNPANNPRFVQAIDPADAPSLEGNLALKAGSPLINAGDNARQVGNLDVLGFLRRREDAIDIGAYESFPLQAKLADIGATAESEFVVANWIHPELVANTDSTFDLVSRSGDLAFDELPTLDHDTGALAFTLTPGTSGFATFTLFLDRDSGADGETAPTYIDFTIKTAGQTVYVDPSAYGGDHSGSSWENAQPSLVTALDYAQPEDEIHVAEGNYRPDEAVAYREEDRSATFTLQSNVALYGGFPSGGADFSQRDPSAYESVLDGGDIFHHVVTGSGTDASAILDGFTIRDGRHTDRDTDNLNGAGLLNDNGSPTIANCAFVGNYTDVTARGGAIANLNGSSPLITNCSFSDNHGQGGAIANLEDSNPTISDCVFINNFGQGIEGTIYTGGAIYNRNSSPHISNCRFEENSAFLGGAIYNLNSSPHISNCRFEGNDANDGGAIYNDIFDDASHPRIANSRFEGNSASWGGAIRGSGAVTLRDTHFARNQATGAGGAIFQSGGPASLRGIDFLYNVSNNRGGAISTEDAILDVVSTRLQGNYAGGSGGAIYNDSSQLTLTNATLTGNYSEFGSGGGVYCDNETSLTVLNSALVSNTSGDPGGAIWAAANPVLLTNSIVWDNNSPIEGPGGLAPESSHNIIQGLPGGFDPLFVLDPDSGGDWRERDTNNYGNLRLSPDSPAVDAGLNPDEPTEFDLGGNPRIQNATIDIGAYEGYRDDYHYLFGHLKLEDDENANGHSNYEDYARGADPAGPHDPDTLPKIQRGDSGQLELTLTQRIDREDIFVEWQTSTTLEADSWRPMQLDVDYGSEERADESALSRTTLTLLPSDKEIIFYRQAFRSTP